ncbi:MAG: hypothetical protein ACRC3Z_02295 [Phocaeicola sp.]
MKKICILATALLFVSQFSLSAQTPEIPAKKTITPEEREVKMTERVAQQLLLSDADAAKFTPLYKKYMEEMRALHPARKSPKSPENVTDGIKEEKVAPTDAEIKKATKERFAQQRKMIDLQEKYYNEFSKFLTAKQVEKIMQPKGRMGHRGEMRGNQAPHMQNRGMEFRKGGEMGQGRARKADAKKPSTEKRIKGTETSNS